MNSYVHSLEQRIAYLESRLGEHGAQDLDEFATNPDPIDFMRNADEFQQPESAESLQASATFQNTNMESAARNAADQILHLLQRSPGQELAFSKILMVELLRARSHKHGTIRMTAGRASIDGLDSEIMNDLDDYPVSLPPAEAAKNLVKAYFQFADFSMPLLHAPTFQKKVDILYGMPQNTSFTGPQITRETKLAVFFVFEVFAVALIVMQKHQPTKISTSLADGYHRTALKALNETGLPDGLEGVQALLLIGQYSYHHPTVWDVWKTVGAALRLAVEQGLHQDKSSAQFDDLTVDTMRRTFWVAYVMDRNISFALGLPSCLSDGAISAKVCSQTFSICSAYMTRSRARWKMNSSHRVELR